MTQSRTLGRSEGTSPTGAVSPPAPHPHTASATALLPGCCDFCREGLAVLPWNLRRICSLCPLGRSTVTERPRTHTGCLSPLLFLSVSQFWSFPCLAPVLLTASHGDRTKRRWQRPRTANGGAAAGASALRGASCPRPRCFCAGPSRSRVPNSGGVRVSTGPAPGAAGRFGGAGRTPHPP